MKEKLSTWTLLQIPSERGEAQLRIIRLNALGSSFFFTKFVLKRDRLSQNLHGRLARSLECEKLHLVLEIPRDHLKTTQVTEGLSMWWALPFDEEDEAMMRELGYGDEWIRWMKQAHDPNTRTLIVAENEPNAIRFGKRIDSHYMSNSLFRTVFPEILPTGSSTWNDKTKHQSRTASGLGEGTYEFLGVGGAVQSRHYDRIIEDDLVGRDAKGSELVMDDTIDYHRLLGGVFDSEKYGRDELGNEVVVGNRWKYFDLNGWIRENEPDFQVESHSAMGGCCDWHSPGQPIFPEEFSLKKLESLRNREGIYNFSHQFLNLPVMEEQCIFNKDWLRFYSLYGKVLFPDDLPDMKYFMVKHEARDGETIPDVSVGSLYKTMIVDPNHAGEAGRARHSIVLVGIDSERDNIYLLDLWAHSASYDDLIANVYKMAKKWKLAEFWLETIAAQKYLKYHIDYRNRIENIQLKVRDLKVDTGRNAKAMRIESLVPIIENGKFHCQRNQSMFLEEYYSYPSTKTKDVLDCLGYAPQTFFSIRSRNIVTLAASYNERWHNIRKSVTGY